MLKPNDIAPEFNSPNQDNENIKLSDYKNNSNVILYFYPKDDTPGCTIEANDFTRLANDFSDNDCIVIGVSKDDCDSHKHFIKKFDLIVELLADTSGAVCKAYNTWQEKEKNDIKKMGIVRSTFVINKAGVIIEAEYGVSPAGHAEKMLSIVKSI